MWGRPRRCGAIDDLSAHDRHLALQVLERGCIHLVWIAIPYRDVGILADLDGPDAVVQEHRVGGPPCVGPQRCLDVHGLGRAKGFGAVGSVQRLTRHRRPQAIAGRKRRDRVVGAAAPLHPLSQVGLERLEPLVSQRAKIAGVVVANPPHEGRR